MKVYNCVKCNQKFDCNNKFDYYYNCSRCLVEFYRFAGEIEFKYVLRLYIGGEIINIILEDLLKNVRRSIG